MQKTVKYTIFKTKWGYFGLAGTENSLLRTHLPHANRQIVKKNLLKNLPTPKYDQNLFKSLQNQIKAYFHGKYTDFDDSPLFVLNGLSDFNRAVLRACKKIRYGQKVTYGQLARNINQPKAARAIGNALGKNPMPLIIPCHRIIKSNGQPGGFSATGGVTIKKRLLSHELQTH